jgi:hypothetical protein
MAIRGHVRAATIGIVILVSIAALVSSALAGPAGRTVRVSVGTNGAQGNQMSGRFTRPAISGNGRFTAFDSEATTLVQGDTNGSADVFVHDASTGVTERVSVATDGTQGAEDSQGPSLSRNGRFVAFYSDADNLVANDHNQVQDVFVRDRQTGTTTLVSVSGGSGTSGNASSFSPAISGNGRFVLFVSDAMNLVQGDTNHVRDIFVRDLVAGTTELVSVATGGTLENSSAAPGAISADGNVVAFGSFASNLVPDDTNDAFDVFVRDRAEGTTVRASVSSAGEQGNAPSIEPAVSGDGAFVAFASDATNLVADDTNERTDVFVYEVLTGETFRASVADDGSEANGQSNGPGIRGGLTFGPAISFDGGRVAFDSVATNLVAGDTNTCDPFFPDPGQCPDVFVRDWVAGTTTRVSVANDGAQSNDASTDPAMDDSGLRVAFFSPASNLVRGDTNTCIQFPTPGHCTDIFVHQSPAAG